MFKNFSIFVVVFILSLSLVLAAGGSSASGPSSGSDAATTGSNTASSSFNTISSCEYTIDRSGDYHLSGDLDCTSTTKAIHIAVEDVI